MTTRHGVVIFMSYLINHLVLINDGMAKQFLDFITKPSN